MPIIIRQAGSTGGYMGEGLRAAQDYQGEAQRQRITDSREGRDAEAFEIDKARTRQRDDQIAAEDARREERFQIEKELKLRQMEAREQQAMADRADQESEAAAVGEYLTQQHLELGLPVPGAPEELQNFYADLPPNMRQQAARDMWAQSELRANEKAQGELLRAIQANPETLGALGEELTQASASGGLSPQMVKRATEEAQSLLVQDAQMQSALAAKERFAGAFSELQADPAFSIPMEPELRDHFFQLQARLISDQEIDPEADYEDLYWDLHVLGHEKVRASVMRGLEEDYGSVAEAPPEALEGAVDAFADSHKPGAFDLPGAEPSGVPEVQPGSYPEAQAPPEDESFKASLIEEVAGEEPGEFDDDQLSLVRDIMDHLGMQHPLSDEERATLKAALEQQMAKNSPGARARAAADPSMLPAGMVP